ncbi:SMP-30/gluconolactonase/LRE family protein [Burkholderia sp. Ac-20379]|uniref:SMP-30/gluconolactonase/LRE family protein n=1 Tax=Burkholderia sp. Ac-20379 TaxID=2703900 RepID=UPI0019817849|nr:SMP-30/gluconolactonase/LRE family protein [Burkholderia sp. Ac-20379]MBN3725747.1 SMP-30/gluconolactonase/LRE family protein [Burkholderia sp. Ac-20379]
MTDPNALNASNDPIRSAGAPAATLRVDSRHVLGECATWCGLTHAFYWTDIEGARLWRHRPGAAQETESWAMPERLGCFALSDDPDVLVVGLATHLALFDLRDGRFERLVEVEPGERSRINDGRCDRAGNLVFGMKDEHDPLEASTGFYRLNADRSLERLALPPAAIANSIAFSPDGTRMYFCDTPTRQIMVCDYRADGPVSNVRPFVALTDATGGPDGSTVDAAGGLWNAQWGGARVVRYDEHGVETDRIVVPTAQPSCPSLGPAPQRAGDAPEAGDGWNTLYITSAREGLDAAALRDDPHAGGVFVAATGYRGLPEARFPLGGTR